MLSLHKETLAELTPADLGSVVGGAYYVSCQITSCLTETVTEQLLTGIEYPKSCFAAS